MSTNSQTPHYLTERKGEVTDILALDGSEQLNFNPYRGAFSLCQKINITRQRKDGLLRVSFTPVLLSSPALISQFTHDITGVVMESITLDGKTYKLEDLPSEGKLLARQATATQAHIKKLEARLAIANTAQSSYVDRLRKLATKTA